MVKFNFSYDASVGLEQRVGFEMAAAIWASVLSDDIEVNLHVGATTRLDNSKAVGGAIPILHKQSYGIFREYYQNDITSNNDRQANDSLQIGNTVDLSIGNQVIDGNTTMVLTSAQAKALGMDQVLSTGNSTTWNRTIVDAGALDGYIVVNNSFDWSYDFTRSGEAQAEQLDFLSMAMHEIGHNLGFVSGLDGAMDVLKLHSGKTQINDFTALDLFRHTVDTTDIKNSDGSVSSVDIGGNAYFSIDGGKTKLADFSTGKDEARGGDGFQASHWKRLQNAMGIMDPTLAYKERLSLSELDLQALDVLGWNVDYQSITTGFDLDTIRMQSEQMVADSLGVDRSVFENSRTDSHLYALSHEQLLDLIQDQMLSLGYSRLWQAFELGYSRVWQEQEESEDIYQLGYSRVWQELEEKLLELGYSRTWQEFQEKMFELGYSRLWQAFELSYSRTWQELDSHIDTVRNASGGFSGNGSTVDHSNSEEAVVVTGGDADDILAGSNFRDLISGGGGDDLIDGKEGDDNLLGEAGNDVLYGWDGNDKLYGGDGDDLLTGEDGNDRLYGEAGADILSGGYGNDIVAGGSGKDQLKGNEGNDVLSGGIGNDDISGGEGNDIAIGGHGEDLVSGGEGNDIIYGDSYDASAVGSDKEDLEEISSHAGFTEVVEDASPVDFWVRLEAEDLALKNFNVEDHYFSSGGSVAITGGRGEATTKFSGPTGIYDIIVGYHDERENKYHGEIDLEIGQGRKNAQKFNWKLDRELRDEKTSIENFTTYTIRGVEIESGERIKIKGESKDLESVALDYIDIISTTQSTAFAGAEFYDGSLYLLKQTKTETEAAAFGGETIEAVKGSREEHWLENILGKTKDVIRVDVSNSQFNLLQDEATVNGKETIRLEAESFSLSGGYEVDHRDDFTSGGAVIENDSKYDGQATTVFTGTSGLYDISVAYLDEQGQGSATFSINGQTLDQWTFVADEETAGYRTLGNQVSLNTGDTISIRGSSDGKDRAIIDYVELTDVTNGPQESYQDRVKVEAEDLLWRGKVDYKSKIDFASGKRLVVAENGSSNYTFEGETGLYSVVLGYADEGKGEGYFSASLGGKKLGSWQLDASRDAIATQTITEEVFINKGDKFNFSTSGRKLQVDYIDFKPIYVDSDGDGQSTGSARTGVEILIEAEHMQLSGKYKAEYSDKIAASNNQYIKHEEQKVDGTASTLFMGETGYYDIVVGYYDISNGEADLQIKLNEETLDAWVLDENVGGYKELSTNNFLTRAVASGVKLTRASDILQIVGRADLDDKAHVDYIKLIQVEEPNTDGTLDGDLSTSSDILRGGHGNDTIYGGDGNDWIYGEDEFDTGFVSVSNSSDILVGGTGNDWIYGNSGDDTLYGDDTIELVSWQFGNGTEPVVTPSIVNPYNTSLGTEIVLQAENMELSSGAKTKGASFASGNDLVELKGGRASKVFSGETGYYDIVVGYHDVEKGDAQLTVKLNEEKLDHWRLNKRLGEKADKVSADNSATRTVASGVMLTQDSDVLQILGREDEKDKGYVDYVRFVKVAAPEETHGSGKRDKKEKGEPVDKSYLEIETEGNGDDFLEGGRGNDKLFGGSGNDTLDGSDAIAKGAFETDILGGGLGADRFILGDSTQSYYVGNGDSDYAIIKDFDAKIDILQLHGSADSYQQKKQGGDLWLSHGQDLVAILEDTNSLKLNSSSASFV